MSLSYFLSLSPYFALSFLIALARARYSTETITWWSPCTLMLPIASLSASAVARASSASAGRRPSRSRGAADADARFAAYAAAVRARTPRDAANLAHGCALLGVRALLGEGAALAP